MKNLVFIAPHGTGKGTQCALLKDKFHFHHISTGEIIRTAISKQDEFAKQLEETINSGKLVDDHIILDMLKKYIQEHNLKDGIIFDGFPRTLNQAISLDNLLNDLGSKIDLVIYLNISKEEALKRTLGRLICPKCHKTYNKYYDYLKPKKENTCDDCNVSLFSRSDDTKESFDNLFDVFLNDTYPILEHYNQKKVLKQIDATLHKDLIFKEIVENLKEV